MKVYDVFFLQKLHERQDKLIHNQILVHFIHSKRPKCWTNVGQSSFVPKKIPHWKYFYPIFLLNEEIEKMKQRLKMEQTSGFSFTSVSR